MKLIDWVRWGWLFFAGLVPVAAEVYTTAENPDLNELFGKLSPGDAVIFNNKSIKTSLDIREPLRDIQFLGNEGRITWNVYADIEDCVFYEHVPESFFQFSGKLRRSLFYSASYQTRNFHLTHSDSVTFYFAMGTNTLYGNNNPGDGKFPQIRLHGFVRGVTIHKPWPHPNHSGTHVNKWAPAVQIYATDPVGNGTGTYIISPFLEKFHGWTPFEVVKGTEVVLAHVCTEQNIWADPIFKVHNGTRCMALCNGVGSRTLATHDAFMSQPEKINTESGQFWGHNDPGVPFRGAAFVFAGQNNKVVANGNYKTWTVGPKPYLPGFHYVSGTLARDPFFESYPNKSGNLTFNLSEPKNIVLMQNKMQGPSGGTQGMLNTGKWPVNGADVPRPVFISIPPLRTAGMFRLSATSKPRETPALAKNGENFQTLSLSGASAILGPDQIEEIYSRLKLGETVELTGGHFDMKGTITSGALIGAGPEKTILQFSPGSPAATAKGLNGADRFGGFINLTVKGGTWGYQSGGTTIGARFVGSVFDGQSEGGIEINGNSQNDIIQDAIFRNSKVGIKCGSFGGSGGGSNGDPFIDRLDITNCTFENLSDKGIDLRVDGGHQPNGQVAVHNCTFKNINGTGFSMRSGQTHLVQGCTFTEVAKSGGPAVLIESAGAAAVTHCDIVLQEKSTSAGIEISGSGLAISHCNIKGYATSLSITDGRPSQVDHTTGDGEISIGEQETYLAKSTFLNANVLQTAAVLKPSLSLIQLENVGQVELDKTPPPRVESTLELMGNTTIVRWKKVRDQESGINGYVFFSGGNEIHRLASHAKPSHPLQPQYWMPDTIKIDGQYPEITVKAINGAGLMSEGGEIAPRRWHHFQGQWMASDGRLIREKDITAINAPDGSRNIQVTTTWGKYDVDTDFLGKGTPDLMVAGYGDFINPCDGFIPACQPPSFISNSIKWISGYKQNRGHDSRFDAFPSIGFGLKQYDIKGRLKRAEF